MPLFGYQPAFNAGEVSPRLHERTDIEKYDKSCRTLKNFIVMPYGGVYRRPGTEYLGETLATEDGIDKDSIFIPFNFSTSTSYQLEIGETEENSIATGYLRVWGSDGNVITRTGAEAWDLMDETDWDVGHGTYSVDDEVENDVSGTDIRYICVKEHTAAAGNEPGGAGGTGWTEFWRRADQYALNAFVSDGGSNYRCILAHTASTANDSQPSSGGDSAVYWRQDDEMTLNTPWMEEDLYSIAHAQINDIMYLTHKDYAPRKLTRTSDTSWTITEISYDDDHYPPLLNENINTDIKTYIGDTTNPPSAWSTTLYSVGDRVEGSTAGEYFECIIGHTGASANKPTTGNTGNSPWQEFWVQIWPVDDYVTLNSSADLFNSNWVGGYFAIDYVRASRRVSVYQATGSNEVASASMFVNGAYTVRSQSFFGNLELQRKDQETGIWSAIETWNADSNTSISATGETEEDSELRLVYTSIDNYALKNIYLERDESTEKGVMEIIEFVSATSVVARTINPPERTGSGEAVHTWQQGAFSDDQGFPMAVTLHEERLFLAGTTAQTQRIWGSQTDDFEQFSLGKGDLDTDGLDWTLGASENNSIQWIASQQGLMVGTAGGEWSTNSNSDAPTITPTNIAFKKRSFYGSENIRAVTANNVVLFVSRLGRKVHELVFNWEQDGFKADDMTLYSEHLTEDEVKQLAYQQQRDSILWCVTGSDDGLVGMTYQRDQGVFGWHRHMTDGTFISISSIYAGDGGTEDECWQITKREINSTTKRYVERFKTGYGASSSPGWSKEESWFLDSGIDKSTTAKTITGITKASPAVVTITSHGYTDGDQIRINSVGGMTEVNDKTYLVANGTTHTFELTTLDGTNVDSSAFTTYTSGGSCRVATTSVSGLTHLEGKTVGVFADGAYHGTFTVSSGAITLTEKAARILVGLEYTSELKPMAVAAPMQDGSSQGRKKRIYQIDVNVLDSLGFSHAEDETDVFDMISFRDAEDPMDDAPPFKSGWFEVPFAGSFSEDGSIIIRQTEPLPLTIRGMVARTDILELE